jgi:hypothetical protein
MGAVLDRLANPFPSCPYGIRVSMPRTMFEAMLERGGTPVGERSEMQRLGDILCDLQQDHDWLEVELNRLRGALSEALSIVDNAARETMLDQDPCFAIALLSEDEQRRLYALLKGGEE